MLSSTKKLHKLACTHDLGYKRTQMCRHYPTCKLQKKTENKTLFLKIFFKYLEQEGKHTE